MNLTQKDLEEFKEAWKNDFGEELTDAEAREKAAKLIELFELISLPLPPKTERTKPPT